MNHTLPYYDEHNLCSRMINKKNTFFSIEF
jgi:hypothetical protein